MATFNSDRTQTTVPARFLHAGVIVETATYTGSATFSAGDVIEMVKLPSGARVIQYGVP